MVHALIVEDDQESAQTLASLLACEGHSAATAGSLYDARRQIAFQRPDVVVLDLRLPDGSGLDLLTWREMLEDTRVVLLTAYASIESSIAALRNGVVDYLKKPLRFDQLRELLADMPSNARPGVEPAQLPRAFAQLLGSSAAIGRLRTAVSRVGRHNVTVLVQGDTGAGKEVVARAIHESSRRAGLPFYAVNCGALSPQLIESELFGHERGAYTGANERRAGLFEQAHGSTLLLDEVTEMPLASQVKLLRVLETGTFSPVGSVETLTTDVRVIATTNRNPEEAVAQGHLREDLYYRLQVFPLHVPSLSQRMEDLPLLANAVLADLALREGHRKHYSDAALHKLAQHPWPGNVRELRNVTSRAYLMAPGEVIEPDDIELQVLPSRAPPAGMPQVRLDVGTSVSEAHRLVTLATLQHCGGHRLKTARMLNISMKTLYTRLLEYQQHQAVAGDPDSADPNDLADPDASPTDHELE
ncbi:sigma-54-dependent transcriptional regulator [Caldimonas brevitalea]|uniref:Response regulator of zinc sigma-54-dependent two-component system n=1 Tax=Caldimonas brevitalea TaxID=413882 RepID=A0A0G3BQY6_9BURK|nr:sigma-54 dependent transcriptional regulator [Caldimonas brevitalea]AKJ30408.1 response regulator of zinc sigma-54-dependent two-component system [Caldimonas brevitalea]